MEGTINTRDLSQHLDQVSTLLAQKPMGLLLDLDGTLSEVVPDPEGSNISEPIRSSLVRLSSRLALVAIITGRSISQARRIVALDDLVYVGNHGLERWDGRAANIAPEAAPYIPVLEEYLAALQKVVTAPGVYFENKLSSFAVHYRNTPDPQQVYHQIVDTISDLGPDQVKLVMGKMVVNVLPPLDLSKGTAVESLVDEHNLRSAIYIGDDVTDLDAFDAITRRVADYGLQGLKVAVVGSEAPEALQAAADHLLSGVPEVGWFLDWLVNHAR